VKRRNVLWFSVVAADPDADKLPVAVMNDAVADLRAVELPTFDFAGLVPALYVVRRPVVEFWEVVFVDREDAEIVPVYIEGDRGDKKIGLPVERTANNVGLGKPDILDPLFGF